MITNQILEAGAYTGVGYVAGLYTGIFAKASTRMAGSIGAISGLALAIINRITFQVAKHFNLPDSEIHLIKAGTTALVAAASIGAFVSSGIVGTTGAFVIAALFSIGILSSLDRAADKWDSNDHSIVNSRNFFLYNV